MIRKDLFPRYFGRSLHWGSPPFDKGGAPNFAATRDFLGLDVFLAAFCGCSDCGCGLLGSSFALFTASDFSFCAYEVFNC